jgi:hypothetical protein
MVTYPLPSLLLIHSYMIEVEDHFGEKYGVARTSAPLVGRATVQTDRAYS